MILNKYKDFLKRLNENIKYLNDNNGEYHYIKKNFINLSANMNIFIDKNNLYYDEYNEILIKIREYFYKIEEIDNEKEFTKILNNMASYLTSKIKSYHNIIDKNNKDKDIIIVYNSLARIMTELKLDNFGSWANLMIENYQSNVVKYNIFNQLRNDFVNDKDFIILKHRAEEIINKYQLSSISSPDLKLLNRFEDKVDNLIENKLKIKKEYFGLNKTLSINLFHGVNGSFSKNNNLISISSGGVSESLLLHEWIHAIDYHIGDKIIPGKYASEIDNSIEIEPSNSIYKSFDCIKRILQQLYSKENIEEIRNNIIKKAIFDFNSVLFKREVIIDEKYENNYFIKVNNYITNPSEKNIKILLNYMNEININCNEEVKNKIKNKEQDLFNVKYIFNNLNKICLSKENNNKRMYIKLIELSQKIFYIYKMNELNKNNVIKSNSYDKDYLLQPTELLARHFEFNNYKVENTVHNVLSLISHCFIMYDISSDEKHQEKQNILLDNVFNEEIYKSLFTNKKVNVKFL